MSDDFPDDPDPNNPSDEDPPILRYPPFPEPPELPLLPPELPSPDDPLAADRTFGFPNLSKTFFPDFEGGLG